MSEDPDGGQSTSSEELRASISRLMRGLNHDLKNPLGAADGYLELMLQGFRGDMSDEQKQTIERVRTLIGAAISILEDVVTFARASLGELRIRLSDSDLSAVARLAVEEKRARAVQAEIELSVTGPGEVRTVTDADLTLQILRQLLANALDHTPAGGSIGVAVERREDAVVIRVRDSGPGIAAADRERVFLEFERGPAPVRERETAGIGFGLPLARALAVRLDGRLLLEGAEGATLMLELPARSTG